MRFQYLLLALWSATSASSLSVFGDQKTLEDTFKVPGDNPLEFCEDPANYILDVKNVDLVPNPPVPGQPLNIIANGTFSEQIDDGAKVQLRVKYNRYITLINTVQDLCANLPKIDIDCPIKKGDLDVVQSVNIPKAVPPGQYDVFAQVLTKDDKNVVCMQATVHFARG